MTTRKSKPASMAENVSVQFFLNPCYKCGGKAAYELYGAYGMDAFKIDYVYCKKCKFKVTWQESEKSDAADKWNSIRVSK